MNKTVSLALGILLILYAPVLASGIVLSAIIYVAGDFMTDLGYVEQGTIPPITLEVFNPFQTTGPIYFAGVIIVALVWILFAIGYAALRLLKHGVWEPDIWGSAPRIDSSVPTYSNVFPTRAELATTQDRLSDDVLDKWKAAPPTVADSSDARAEGSGDRPAWWPYRPIDRSGARSDRP